MKINLLIALLLLLPINCFAETEIKINEIEFTDTNLIDVVRTLSELSNSNIIATPAATENKITVHLKNVSVLEALKSISRISDLWYRYDEDTDTYRIMTREEYGKDLIVRESEHIEVFNVLNANVKIIAQAIEDLYGSRVILSLGVEAGQKMSSGSSSGRSNSSSGSSRSGVRNSRSTSNNNRSNNRSNSGGNNTSYSGTRLDTNNLNVDQIELLANQLNGGTVLDTQALQQVSVQAQPIYVTVNNEHNLIIVRTDDRKIIKSIADLIQKMDVTVPQVMLEMKILSIILGDDFNSIFNFELQPSGNNQSIKPIKLGNNALLNSGSFIYEFLNTRLRANIEFLEQNKRIKVLSNPMVMASNHREAELFIGEESLLTRGFRFNPALIDNGIVISPSYVETETELEEIGITLRITPRINNDNTVTLELEQESSTINPGGASLPISDGTGNVLNLPVDTVNTARLTGTVMARNGLTVAVGGLIRTSKKNNEKKVPVLSEIPVLGRIFRSNIESEEETETVLLITPRILNKADDSEDIRKTDNRFYQDLNRGYPDLAPLPNKFINKEEAPVTLDPKTKRQSLYMEMSNYAAETVRIAETERVKDSDYQPIKVNQHNVPSLLGDSRINTRVLASWRRGGMHVTALEVANRSKEALPVDFQNLNGQWLASSVESSVLAPKDQAEDRTYLYLISALSFDEALRDVRK